MAVFKCAGRHRGACDYEAESRWRKFCPGCGRLYDCEKIGSDSVKSTIDTFSSLEVREIKRISTGISEFDHVLGGGLVPGSTVVVNGPPKLGKTTLLVQVARGAADSGLVLYSSGEQSKDDVGVIVHRTKSQHEKISLMGNEGDVYKIVEWAEDHKPKLIIVDSAQVAYMDDIRAAEGSAEMIKGVAQYLTSFGKATKTAVLLICHVNKDGEIAGPKMLEHLVDTIVDFDFFLDEEDEYDYDDPDNPLRQMSCGMNRNAAGPGVARAVFCMTLEGIKPVQKKSKLDIKPRRPRPRLKPV